MLDARALVRQEQLSNEEKIAKYLAESNRDIRKFMREQLKITDIDSNVVPLELNVSQQIVYAKILKIQSQNKPVRIIILKSRQCGISTAASGLIFARTLTKPNTSSVIIGHHKDATANLFGKQRYFYENLADTLKEYVPLYRSNKQELYCKLLNWRISLATAGTVAVTRSNTISNLLYTEAAFYDDFKTLRGGTEAAVPRKPHTMVVIETTANGSDNDYHKLWKKAVAGESAYEPIFLFWGDDPQYTVPEFLNDAQKDEILGRMFERCPDLVERQKFFKLSDRQIAFYGEMMLNYYDGDEQIMQQEFPCTPEEAFLASGKPLVPQRFTMSLVRRAHEGKRYDPEIEWRTLADLTKKESPHMEPNKRPYIEIFQMPRPGRFYLVAADPAQGLEESDFSCAQVLDIATRNLCATIHGRIDLESFADYCVRVATAYNYALIMPEVDGLGAGLLSFLKRKYHRIYQQRMKKGYTEQLTQKLGWETQPDTRKEIVASMRLAISENCENPDFIPDRATLDELLTFVWRDGKPQAMKGCHDDRVMALAIGYKGCFDEIIIRPEILKTVSTSTNEDSKINKRKLSIEETVALIKNPNWYGQSLDEVAMKAILSGPVYTEGYELW